jgi:hypothetical protein
MFCTPLWTGFAHDMTKETLGQIDIDHTQSWSTQFVTDYADWAFPCVYSQTRLLRRPTKTHGILLAPHKCTKGV